MAEIHKIAQKHPWQNISLSIEYAPLSS